MSRKLYVLCTLLLGCAILVGVFYGTSPPRDSVTATTSQPQENKTSQSVQLETSGDPLPENVNPKRVLRRVQSLTDTSAPSVHLKFTQIDPRSSRTVESSHRFHQLMNLTITYPKIETVAGLTRSRKVEILYTEQATPKDIELTLAHEFTHVIQPKDLDRRLKQQVDQNFTGTFDARLAQRSTKEGTAEYVANAYRMQYLEDPPSDDECSRWQQMTTAKQHYWTPYCLGSRYVSSQIESPRHLDQVFDRAPTTMEQVIHEYPPSQEPRRSLSVRTVSNTSNWDLTRTDSLGEFYIRTTLRKSIDSNQARRAASGWGNDVLHTYYNRSRSGHVWILRWDDSANATEFETIFSTYLSNRFEREDGVWSDSSSSFRVKRVTEDTVAVIAGDPKFVSSSTIVGEKGNITIQTS